MAQSPRLIFFVPTLIREVQTFAVALTVFLERTLPILSTHFTYTLIYNEKGNLKS